MNTLESGDRRPLDAEAERRRFRRYAAGAGRFDDRTYTSDAGIDHRTDLIFNTFARVLRGRGRMPDEDKAAERRQLNDFVRREVVHPLLRSPTEIAATQDDLDRWHEQAVETLQAKCPIQWDGGTALTVGMVQKIINLHLKSLWTLEVVLPHHSRFFHATIDDTTLRHLLDRRGLAWTKLDSYERYMAFQQALRRVAGQQATYPLALECWNWLRHNRPSAV